jgi:hypothetical protein
MRVALLIICSIGVGMIAVGFWWVHANPEPMTIEQCGAAARASTDFQKLIADMDEANRAAAYETGAMRCVLDHDPETASWPEDKKQVVIIRAYCQKKADGNYVAQAYCEELLDKERKRVNEYGRELIFIPKSLR